MGEEFFNAKEDKFLKHITLFYGEKKGGKKIAEGIQHDFKKKMTSEAFLNAERHPTKRYVVKKFEETNGKLTIELEEINIEKLKQEIIKKLSDKINTTAMLDDVLGDLTIQGLKELHSRTVEHKGKVKSKEGCYKLTIGGKKGRPMELMLRD